MTLAHYAHLFDEARLGTAVPVVEGISAARAELRRAGLRPSCDEGAVRVLRQPRGVRKDPA